ncbi:MAG: dCMP deaminase family protein [Lachnospiraceae bacterium]|nr:dCMP deaminase family protein [Lachnospiraceae bacterium]
MKREDYLNWDQYFMSVARISAERSKDPNTCVGACLVGVDNRIISTGYNGFPRGCSDDEYPWDREAESELGTKYMYCVHAELNAILNGTGRDMKNARLYTTLFPCNECAKAIIQVGISEVIYLENKYAKEGFVIASMRMLDSAGVIYRKYEEGDKELIMKI